MARFILLFISVSVAIVYFPHDVAPDLLQNTLAPFTATGSPLI